jgi:hypothetical protein
VIDAAPTTGSEVSALADAERRRGLEAGWLATFVVAFAVIGVSWLVGASDQNISGVLWTVFGCLLGGLALDTVLGRVQTQYGAAVIFEFGHAFKVVWLSVLWHLVGGIENPAFLIVFLLPVTTAGVLLMRRQALITAGLTVTMVTFLALCESSDLRWYLVQIGLPVEPLLSRLPHVAPHVAPFRGEAVSPEFQFVALVVFTSLLVAAALLSCLLARRTVTLFERFLTASYAMDYSNDLVRSAVREDPHPTVVVYADSAQIVEVSRGFLNQMLLGRAALPGATLFDCLTFSEPRAIRELLARSAGELRFVRYRVGKEPRTAAFRCHRFRIGSVDYASVSLTERDELSYLWDVCHAVEHALLVVRNDREVVYFNAAAQRLCPALHFGMEPATFAKDLEGASAWWLVDPGSTEAATIVRQREESYRVETFHVRHDADERLVLVGLFAATSAEAFDMERATA